MVDVLMSLSFLVQRYPIEICGGFPPWNLLRLWRDSVAIAYRMHRYAFLIKAVEFVKRQQELGSRNSQSAA